MIRATSTCAVPKNHPTANCRNFWFQISISKQSAYEGIQMYRMITLLRQKGNSPTVPLETAKAQIETFHPTPFSVDIKNLNLNSISNMKKKSLDLYHLFILTPSKGTGSAIESARESQLSFSDRFGGTLGSFGGLLTKERTEAVCFVPDSLL